MKRAFKVGLLSPSRKKVGIPFGHPFVGHSTRKKIEIIIKLVLK